MSSDVRIAQSPGGNLRTLGVFWIVYGIVRLVMAVCLFIYSGTATLMFGALLNRVPDPFSLMTDFHFFYIVMIALVGSLRHSGDHRGTGSACRKWLGPRARSRGSIFLAVRNSTGLNFGDLYFDRVASNKGWPAGLGTLESERFGAFPE